MGFIISGYPGIGKTYLTQNSSLKVTDSDSSSFSWIEPGVRHPDFPQNYINHIKKAINEFDIVVVSSHKVVRDTLRENGLDFVVFYPSIESKEIYIERYKQRGNNEKFIDLVNSNWESWITEIESEETRKVKMVGDTFLSDYIIE